MFRKNRPLFSKSISGPVLGLVFFLDVFQLTYRASTNYLDWWTYLFFVQYLDLCI